MVPNGREAQIRIEGMRSVDVKVRPFGAPQHPGTFYLAGSLGRREALIALARRIEHETGLECIARWLNRDFDGEGVGALNEARFDLEDASRAETVVIAHGESTAGGTFVEMGIALANTRAVVMWRNAWGGKAELPVFAELAHVVDTAEALIETLRARARPAPSMAAP